MYNILIFICPYKEKIMENNKKIFSEQSLEKMSAPEQFTDYLRITNPSTWLVILAMILLLAALIVWSNAGHLETSEKVIAVVSEGTANVIITDQSRGQVKNGMIMRINSEEYRISSVGSNEYGRTVASAPVYLRDGMYDADIIIENISPIDFLFE